MINYNSFAELYRNEIIHLIKKNPDWIRLDGAISKGNQNIFGKFYYKNRLWRINSDSHLDKLTKIYDCFMNGKDPFKINKTSRGSSPTLELKKDSGYKHLYIYQIK